MEKKNLAIVIIIYNIADLITKQIECIRLFCKDESYDIIVVDNSTDRAIIEAIQYYVSDKNIIYLKTQSADSYNSRSHAFACNVSYSRFKNEYKKFFYMDHDLFPIKDFSVADVLKDKVIAGLGQAKSKDYFWPGCVMWNNESVDNSVVDFSTNNELGLDTGGNLYRIIEKHGKEWCAFFDEKYYENPFYQQSFYNFYATINDDTFMHFINSSNWNPVVDNKGRISTLLHILEGKLV
jgi:glycosyltransferase involved in cell wall biosynthesis